MKQCERGSVLKSLRREAGVSQFKVAASVGLDPKTIYRLEAGTAATISRKSAEKLAGFFNKALCREIAPDRLGYQIGRLKKEQEGRGPGEPGRPGGPSWR